VKRADFKLDMLSPHLFMNFRVVDEHGRQLGTGATWARSRPSWGAGARGFSRRWRGSNWQGSIFRAVRAKMPER
jgi:ATP-dependent helicase HrpA